MSYIDRGDRMASSYSNSQTLKWQKKYFHLLDPTVLNSYIILSSCGSKTDHRKFHLTSVHYLMEMSTRESHPQSTPRGRPSPQASH
jgi:hypothetical protein